jgi:hypothetical protein
MDSFYEYLFKAYILLGGDEYLEMFDVVYSGVMAHIRDPLGFVYKNVNMFHGKLLTRWVDSLAAFFSRITSFVWRYPQCHQAPFVVRPVMGAIQRFARKMGFSGARYLNRKLPLEA